LAVTIQHGNGSISYVEPWFGLAEIYFMAPYRWMKLILEADVVVQIKPAKGGC